MRALVSMCLVLFAHSAFAADAPTQKNSVPEATSELRTDRLFAKGHVTDKPVFTQETHIDVTADGTKNWNSVIKDADDQIVMTEVAVMKNDRIVTQYVEQRQIGVAHELKVEGDKAIFKKFDWADGQKGKEVESNTVDAGEKFLMGPMTDAKIQQNWNELMNGKTIKADFGVFEFLKTIDFKFFKTKDVGDDVELHMKPASFLIAMVAPVITLRFNKTTHKLTYFSGPTPLKIKEGGKWKEFQAEIFYP